jgi:hypothetical protein
MRYSHATTFALILILIVVLAFYHKLYQPTEWFVGIGEGACYDETTKTFGKWRYIDGKKSGCISTSSKKKKKIPQAFMPCDGAATPTSLSCTAPWPQRPGPTPKPVTTVQAYNAMVGLINDYNKTEPGIVGPQTQCLAPDADFEEACRDKFGFNYGYQSLLGDCYLPEFRKALCSQAYRVGYPRFEPYSTDCGHYLWEEESDPLGQYGLQVQCTNLYGPKAKLTDITSLGCTAPNQARGICRP